MRLRDLHRRSLLVYGITILLSAVAATLMLVANAFFGVSLPIPLETMAVLFTAALFVFPALVEASYGRWRRQIDDNLPKMLLDTTGNVKSGLSLTRALELAAEADYGPLSEQLRITRAQLSWGITFEEAMSNQIRRVDSQIAKRTFAALLEAGRAGGKIEDVLEVLGRHTSELRQIDKERLNALRPYTMTTYIAMGVFLAISVILINSFFVQIFATQQKLGTQAATVFAVGGGLTLPGVKNAFLQIALIEAVFGGLGAGKLGEASFAAGLKHVIILVVVTVLAFTFLVG